LRENTRKSARQRTAAGESEAELLIRAFFWGTDLTFEATPFKINEPQIENRSLFLRGIFLASESHDLSAFSQTPEDSPSPIMPVLFEAAYPGDSDKRNNEVVHFHG
jgi:hypothetical protein